MRIFSQLRQLQPPAPMGFLAESVASKLPIIKSAPHAIETTPAKEKFHPLTVEGRSASPGMVQLPQELTKAIAPITLEWTPQEVRQRVALMYQNLQQSQAVSPAFEKLDVDAHILGIFLQNYATLTHALREIKKRRPEFDPHSILDVGFGPATGILASRSVFGHTPNLEESTYRETAVIIGHPRMKRRAKEFLGESKILFRDEVPSTSSPKRFDLIIATNQLYQHGKLAAQLVDSHSQRLGQLLNKNGVILFLERGDPLGFEAIVSAREHLMRHKFGFSVVGPCSHNRSCPLQLGLETRQNSSRPGRENWCRFSQNVERPRFTKELKKGQYLSQKWVPEQAFGAGGSSLKGKGRPGANSNEIANFSWVALENAKPRDSESWPRIMKQPLKRHGHVTMEVCAPSGNIEHWTVPRSHGKQTYHDVRKANAGDLWALDAKTKQVRGGLRFAGTQTEVLAESHPETHTGSHKNPATNTVFTEPSKDWWNPSSNPFFKFSSHQERILNENNVEPTQDSFLSVMDSLISDEGRFDKLMSKEKQRRYRK